MAQPIYALRPLRQIAGVDAPHDPLPGGAVAKRGNGHHVVGHPGAVGVVQIVEQTRIVARGERGHPPLAKRALELVLADADHLVDFVEEEQRANLVRKLPRCVGAASTAIPAPSAVEVGENPLALIV